MVNMAAEVVGSVIVAVHTASPPSDDEWQHYLGLLVSVEQRIGLETSRAIVFTDGGGPNFSQRQAVNNFLRGRTGIGAVVTSSAFARGLVGALNVFNPAIKAFRPDAVEQAFDHLKLTDAQRKDVLQCRRRLVAQLLKRA